jgi:hypothetical protein
MKRPTFYARFPEVVAEVVEIAAQAGHKTSGRPRDERAREQEAQMRILRRERDDLRRHLDLYAEHIRRLTIENSKLREELERNSSVTVISPRHSGQ